MQVQIKHNYAGVFRRIVDYLSHKFELITAKRFDAVTEPGQKSVEFQSESQRSDVNSSQESRAGSESEQERREKTPWMEGSGYSFIRCGVSGQTGYRSLTLRKLEKKKDQTRELDFEIVFESRHCNHAVKFAKLIQTYLDAQHENRKLAFFWL